MKFMLYSGEDYPRSKSYMSYFHTGLPKIKWDYIKDVLKKPIPSRIPSISGYPWNSEYKDIRRHSCAIRRESLISWDHWKILGYLKRFLSHHSPPFFELPIHMTHGHSIGVLLDSKQSNYGFLMQLHHSWKVWWIQEVNFDVSAYRD